MSTSAVPSEDLHAEDLDPPRPHVEPTLLDMLMGLPEEVLNLIYSLLDITSLDRFSRSCKVFYEKTAPFMFQKIQVLDFTMVSRARIPDWKCQLVLQEMSECTRLRYTTEILYLPWEIAATSTYFARLLEYVPNLTHLCVCGIRLRLTESTAFVLQLPGLRANGDRMDSIHALGILLSHLPQLRTVALPHPMSADLYSDPLTTGGDFEAEAAAQRTDFQAATALVLSKRCPHIQHVRVEQVLYPDDLPGPAPVLSLRLTAPYRTRPTARPGLDSGLD